MAEAAGSLHSNDDREIPTANGQQCAICQDVINQNNASVVDLCMHQYCFPCLKQWCEVSVVKTIQYQF